MGFFVNRSFVRDRLRLKLRQSFRICPSRHCALIATDDVLDLLNRSRVRIAECLTDIPSDLMTPEELAAAPELENSGLTAHKLSIMTRRAVKCPPHFRLNSHTIRFSRRLFLNWLEGKSA